MSDTYTKLFSSITTSTIVSEPVATRWVWVTMLALVKPDGCVYGSVPGLARVANVTLEECEAALRTFLTPDKYSRTKDHDGRRVEEIALGGWRLLNHAKYDAIRGAEERREYWRQHKAKKRAESRDVDIVDIPQSPQPSTESTPSASPSTSKEQKKEHPAQPAAARGKRGSRIPDDWQPSAELREWAKREHPSVDLKLETAKFIDFWQAKAGRDAAKLDWTATFRNWIRNARTATGFVAPPATVGGHARQTKEQALKPAESRFESQMRYLSGELKAGRITQEKFDAETIFWRNKLKGQK